jgi:hypothetical protein
MSWYREYFGKVQKYLLTMRNKDLRGIAAVNIVIPPQPGLQYRSKPAALQLFNWFAPNNG